MPARTHRRPVRVMETFRIIFYAPIYVAVAGGFWEGEGLDVTFATCAPPFPHALAALNQDAADIAQSGIMRSIIALDWGAETVPAHIAKINSRDGFFVLARRPQEEFCWESLRGATVIPVGFSPMPWASFQFALRRHGVEPEELRLVPGLALDRAVAAFQGGEGDFIHLPQPAAEQLLGAGQAYLAVALGPVNGHLAYSSFAASSRFLDARPEAARSFVRAFSRGSTRTWSAARWSGTRSKKPGAPAPCWTSRSTRVCKIFWWTPAWSRYGSRMTRSSGPSSPGRWQSELVPPTLIETARNLGSSPWPPWCKMNPVPDVRPQPTDSLNVHRRARRDR